MIRERNISADPSVHGMNLDYLQPLYRAFLFNLPLAFQINKINSLKAYLCKVP